MFELKYFEQISNNYLDSKFLVSLLIGFTLDVTAEKTMRESLAGGYLAFRLEDE